MCSCLHKSLQAHKPEPYMWQLTPWCVLHQCRVTTDSMMCVQAMAEQFRSMSTCNEWVTGQVVVLATSGPLGMVGAWSLSQCRCCVFTILWCKWLSIISKVFGVSRGLRRAMSVPAAPKVPCPVHMHMHHHSVIGPDSPEKRLPKGFRIWKKWKKDENKNEKNMKK